MENIGEVHIYQTPKGDTAIEVKVENETVWLRQEQIAELFDRDRTVITRHINNIFKENRILSNQNHHNDRQGTKKKTCTSFTTFVSWADFK